MPDKLNISRRDFINGIALSLAAGTSLSPLQIMAATNGKAAYYPPALTGLRGSHAGSFEIAHAVTMAGGKYDLNSAVSDSVYDLVVVGGGISGLTAAKLFRDQAGAGKKILVLDNHDDFGGHAKRNEFDVDGKILQCHGGSQSLESPSSYSKESKAVLASLGVEPQRFYEYFDREFRERHKLRAGIYFAEAEYGRNVTAKSLLGFWADDLDKEEARAVIAEYPISEESKQSFLELWYDKDDYLSGRSYSDKIELMRNMSYSQFLREHTSVTEEVVTILRDSVKSYWGLGMDILSALEGYRLELPGTYGLGISLPKMGILDSEEPYIFHFPDGNASIARLLVRDLIPGIAPGTTMEDIVTASMDYSLLDVAENDVRVRLNSTAISVAHDAERSSVDITYVRDGKPERVRARHTILACYNQIIPHICAEVPDAQREAIEYAQKTPLAYISIAIRDWQAFKKLGIYGIYQPQSDLMHSVMLDFPVSMGDYRFTAAPDEPAVLHGTFAPTLPDQGLTQKEQNLAGQRRLLSLSFDDFEKGIVNQLDGALGPGGFQSASDILGITVNRWPHGYAYEYNELFDGPDFSPKKGPHIAGRAQIGRISIANSDSSAYAYVDGAIDAAVRAVNEQLAEVP
jgi:spermidine dehydrogenase